MKNNLPQIRAKWAAVEAFMASLPDPDIYCFFGDITNDNPDPLVAFVNKRDHGHLFQTLGAAGWKRVLSMTGRAFHFQKIVNGVLVELTDAQPNAAVPLFPSEVDAAFFGQADTTTQEAA